MPLQKQTLEFPIKGGLLEKVPKELLTDGFATRAENVDLRKDGSVRRRRGFSAMSTAAIVDNQSATFDANVRRLATREQQALVAISDTAHILGSGGGSSGAVGSTIYEYTSNGEIWTANGTIPIPTVEQVWGHSKIHEGAIQSNSAVAAGDGYLVLACTTTYSLNTSVMVEVIDLTDNSCVLRTSNSLSAGGDVVGAVWIGGFFYVISNFSASTVEFVKINTGSIAAGLATGTITLTRGPRRILGLSTDGTYLFVVYNEVATNSLVLERFQPTGGGFITAGNVTVSAVAEVSRTASVDARSGTSVDVFWTDPVAGRVRGARYDTALASAWAVYSLDGTSAATWEKPHIATVTAGSGSTGLAIACWVKTNGQQRWALVTNGALLGIIHEVTGEFVDCQPWLMGAHCYTIARDSNQETNATYPRLSATNYCIELDVDRTLAGVSFRTLLPCAAWLTDIGSTVIRAAAYQYNSKSYVVVGRWVDGGDVSWNVRAYVTQGFHHSRPVVYALNFSEAKRYQNVEWNGLTVFAGGTPWVYDGLHAHEACHLQWPRLTAVNGGAGSLVVGTNYVFRCVFKYVDKAGRIYWSEPSSLGEKCSWRPTGAGDNSVNVTISTPLICAMPQGGFGFAGTVSCEVYVATEPNVDVFVFLSSTQVDQFYNGALPVLSITVPPSADETRSLYTLGGELENVTPPPCLSVESHRGRLWLAATDENKVWFSKPPQPQRGPEFCLEFTFDLPAPCTALVSNEDRILIFTKKSIFFVEGDGPGSTGVPVNGFSKLAQLYVDEGCVEQNAAVRTPYGVIYRGRKGFMLMTRGLELKYIGEGIEDSFGLYVSTILSMTHDPKLGCCAIVVVSADGDYRNFRFWYDTAQWSIDILETDMPEIRDSVVLGDDYYHAMPAFGVWKSQDPLGAVHADDGEFVPWVWESGWIRFADLHSFKRLWRMFLTARQIDEDDSSDLQVELFKDYEATPFQLVTFRLVDGETRQFRVHLKKQKLRTIKVKVSQIRGVGSLQGSGCELLGLGFEAAIKQGGAKLGKAETR